MTVISVLSFGFKHLIKDDDKDVITYFTKKFKTKDSKQNKIKRKIKGERMQKETTGGICRKRQLEHKNWHVLRLIRDPAE